MAALFTAARGARVRRATYQHDAGLTEGQAVRDLRLLAQHDLIRPHGETKARHYTATSRLTTLNRHVTAELPPIREPYQR